jgi:hypothetical protein
MAGCVSVEVALHRLACGKNRNAGFEGAIALKSPATEKREVIV